MSITVTSTTDSQEVVNAVNGVKASETPAEEKKSASAENVDETEENSEALENESDEVEGDAAEESEDETEDDEEKVKDDEPKPKKGFKNRIQKLRSRVSERDQIIAQRDAEIKFLREQAVKGKASENESQKEDAPKETKQDGKPESKNFESWEDYVEALADWKLEQKETARTAKERETQVKTEYQKALDSHNARVAEFQKTQKDYQDVVGDFLEEHGDVKFSPALEESILTSDLGPALLYELAKNPEELMRINSLGYGAAQRAIGKIEARLEKSSESSQTEIKKQTKAPPPVKPVGSSKAPVKKSIYDPNLSFAEYERLRAEQLRNR